MNLIISSSAAAVALILLLTVIFARIPFIRATSKKFIIATTAVYLSGTILILSLSIFMSEVPASFVVISEASILFVYIVTMITIVNVTKHIGEILKDVEQGKIKGEEPDGGREKKEESEEDG